MGLVGSLTGDDMCWKVVLLHVAAASGRREATANPSTVKLLSCHVHLLDAAQNAHQPCVQWRQEEAAFKVSYSLLSRPCFAQLEDDWEDKRSLA